MLIATWSMPTHSQCRGHGHSGSTSSTFDFSWKNLIYGPGPALIKFVLNASIKSLPTPDLQKIMKYKKDASCKLCGTKQCTVTHILSSCSYALKTQRYTWRHNSVLGVLQTVLEEQILKANSNSIQTPKTLP